MEAVVVVLRPKQHLTVSQDFRAKAYDILLTEQKHPNSDKEQKQLPKTTISFEEEPAETLCNFVYNITGAEFGGLKGKRAVFVPPSRTEPVGDQDSFVKGALYCVPIDSKEKLNAQVVDNLPASPGFYSLDRILERINGSNPLALSRQARVMLLRLESWMREKYNVPGAMDLLFSVCTEDRLKRSITNPAYLTDSESGLSTSLLEEEYSRTIANEALAKMMAIEKCDMTVINPLFGSDMLYRSKVDACAVNKFWGLGKPDYTKILSSLSSHKFPHSTNSSDSSWLEDFPMHKYAHEGDAEGIRDLINKGQPVSKLDLESWAPIHYAAWFGHLECISVLLNEGNCSPNLSNKEGSTPLHLAATKGRVYVTELLLNHQDIDSNAVDSDNKTALSLCENIEKPDHQSCAKLLHNAVKRPLPTIQVSLMDGTYRSLNLMSGANTTVQQLHSQMMRELNMPESCAHLFTIWICSRNLQLQLKPDHKPIQHLNDWKRKIVAMLTDHEPSREDPQLFWRRDAILSIVEERRVKHAVAINLLFHEAYHNYIKSMYPCAEQDAIILGGILMQLNQGDFDARKARNYFSTERSLQTLIPQTMLRNNRKTDWTSKFQAQYKHYSQSMANRDRSPQFLQQHFLQICWNLTVYGAAFFTGYVQMKTSRMPTTVYIGVNDIGVHVINASSKSMLQSFNYKDIEWQHKDNQPVLEIKLSGSSRGGMSILTKQAQALNHLINGIQQRKEENRQLEELKKQVKVQQAMVRQQRLLQEQRHNQSQAEDMNGDVIMDVTTPRARLREWHHRLKEMKEMVNKQREEGLDLLPSYPVERMYTDLYDSPQYVFPESHSYGNLSNAAQATGSRLLPSSYLVENYFSAMTDSYSEESQATNQLRARVAAQRVDNVTADPVNQSEELFSEREESVFFLDEDISQLRAEESTVAQ